MNIYLAHLIGDYLMQNDWMALNKKKSTWACTALPHRPYSVCYVVYESER